MKFESSDDDSHASYEEIKEEDLVDEMVDIGGEIKPDGRF